METPKINKRVMKIKDECAASTSEFWYDLTDGGYLDPEDMLEDPEDVTRVRNAIAVIREFEAACNEQIDGFMV